MPGTAEFAAAEFRILRFTDLELIEMVENHPGDYEPWAVDIGRAELARRDLAPPQIEMLRAESAAIAASTPQTPHFFPGLILHLLSMVFPFGFLFGLLGLAFDHAEHRRRDASKDPL
jgi:hypothetical protein